MTTIEAVDPEAHAEAVLDAAADRDPDWVFALVSGGHDSATAMHVAHESAALDLDGVVHINTGIGIPETREWVRERAADLGLPYIEIRNHYYHQQYPRLVKKHGFPSPQVHHIIYGHLKGKPLRWFVDGYAGDVMFVSGVFRRESDRRMQNVPVDGIGENEGATWVSPLVEWTALEIREYRRRHDLPMNEVVDILEMSGECLCGAMADRKELNLLREFYRDTWRFINCLEVTVENRAKYGDDDHGPDPEHAEWGHHSDNEAWYDVHHDDDPGQQMLLCTDCEARYPRSENSNN